jgi:signal transduction histidine kinase
VRFRSPARFSIRNRLLVYFVCLVVLTAVAIIASVVVIASRDAHQRVVGQLKSVATLKQQEVDSWIGQLRLSLDIVLYDEGVERDLRTLSDAPHGSAAYRAAHRRVLRRFSQVSRRVGAFEELFFMGRRGQVLVSTDSGHERQQLGMNDYFTEGLRDAFIQEPSYALSLDKMTVVASRPVSDREGAFGVLAGRANLDSLNAVMVGRAGLGDTGETYLVGSNHRLLTDLRREGHEIPSTYVRTRGADIAIEQGRSGFASYTGYDGRQVIGVYRWIPKLQVAMLAEQGESEALRATRLALWTTVSIAILATLLAILVGTMLIHTIVRPLSALGETAGRIADGELGLTASVKRDDEIGKLATSFNRMTGRLHEVAASEERRRLARDLHDAVSQSLFSVSLIAEVLPRIYEKDPAAGRERLEELRQLTRGALAEMRMLLLELRPAALAETSLPDLLGQLAEAVIGRARIPVDVELDKSASGPPDVNVALYRIAQETLNNTVKHAGAGRARIELSGSWSEGEQSLTLIVADDGCGFDTNDVRAGRLGLGIMAERAESIGAHLDIDSAPGEGTRVTVVWVA